MTFNVTWRGRGERRGGRGGGGEGRGGGRGGERRGGEGKRSCTSCLPPSSRSMTLSTSSSCSSAVAAILSFSSPALAASLSHHQHRSRLGTEEASSHRDWGQRSIDCGGAARSSVRGRPHQHPVPDLDSRSMRSRRTATPCIYAAREC